METNFKKLWIGSGENGLFDYEVKMLSNGFCFQFQIDCETDIQNEVHWIECPNGVYHMDSELIVKIKVQPGDLIDYQCYNSKNYDDIEYPLFLHELTTISKMFEKDLEDYLINEYVEE